MKKLALAMAISATFVFIVLGLGCAGPAPAVLPGTLSQRDTQPLFGDDPTKDQAVLDDLQQATQGIIAELVMSGQPVPDYQYSALRSIEDARVALRELETQWVATQMVIGEYIMAREPVPDYEYEVLKGIETCRQAVLITHGLVD